ncbi:hypothetical protein SAMN05216362_10578 [Piscibacillus halophilus]|uniref:Uncharacterized protein n=1 Tax=Piscibacillus halophilus TaxID=571933 RepID=A0A1H9CID3_9BACI|nr:hypothetical protein SAMN05216362_10578 [Piscibacillus halophilus]
MTFLYIMIGVILVTWIGMAVVLFKTNLLDK